MSGQLIVSVSGIRDETRPAVDSFAREMDARGVPLSLLVAPRMKDHYRLARDPHTQEWLLERREGGDAIVLHGYDQAATKRRRAEFAVLPEHEALVGHLFGVARIVAARLGLENGYRLIINCKSVGGQEVPHLHAHLLGGRKLKWPPG